VGVKKCEIIWLETHWKSKSSLLKLFEVCSFSRSRDVQYNTNKNLHSAVIHKKTSQRRVHNSNLKVGYVTKAKPLWSPNFAFLIPLDVIKLLTKFDVCNFSHSKDTQGVSNFKSRS